jgi:hypothetical protein
VQPGDEAIERVRVDVGSHDARALLAEPLSQRAADSTARSCDDSQLSFHSTHDTTP